MAIAIRSQGTSASTTSTSLVLSAPGTIQSGDYLIAFIAGQSSTAASDASSSGWTRIGPPFVASDLLGRFLGMFAKVASGSEPSTYTFTMPTASARSTGFVASFSGVDTADPVAYSSAWTKLASSNSSLSVGAEASTANLYTLQIWTGGYTSPNSYALSSYTGGLTLVGDGFSPAGAENTGVSRTALRVWGGVAPGGGVPSHSITTGTAATMNTGFVSLNEDPGGGGPTGLPLKVSDGSGLVDAYFQLADGAGGLVTPGAYRVVRPGYSSVTQMLAQTTFYCAHRGGSLEFPEMSMYAYGQATLRGYPALELSLARSSDGVWFGLHDASLDRTSLGTGGGSGTTLMAASMTWAQIQAYDILGSTPPNNPTQPDRPYMRWEEIIDLYYGTHVIFVDPKVALAHYGELINMMDALPGTPTDHFVAKYFGEGNASGWPANAKAAGYTTWGYFYGGGNWASWQHLWDIMGMDYSASSGDWTSILSYGKPVMAHTINNAGAATTALSKGADGMMVSATLALTPPAIT